MGDRHVLAGPSLAGGGSGGSPLPPACWPPGSPEGSRCRHGAMPGRQGRMSGTPPPRRPARRSHSSLTACPGPRLAGHGRWRVRDAPSARAASLASSAAPPGDGAMGLTRSDSRAAPPTAFPTSTPTSLSTRWGCVPLASLAERISAGHAPLGGVERPRRVVRFARLIHAARPRSWRTCGPRRLRRQSQACPGCHAPWCGMTRRQVRPAR